VALNAINLPKGSKVLVPSFICRDLMAAIHQSGCVPIFFEVDHRLDPIALPDDRDIRVVLAVNYFGFPQNINVFVEYCKRIGAVLIEDNAHGFLSEDPSGRLLGSRGDLGIFSMRKTLLLPGGAALVANDPKWVDALGNQLSFDQKPLPLAFRLKILLSFLQRILKVNSLAWGQDIARLARWVRTGHAIAPLPPEDEFNMPDAPHPHVFMLEQHLCSGVSGEKTRRRDLYDYFQKCLAGYDVRPVFSQLPSGVVPYGFPFYAEESVAKKIMKISRMHGLDCIRWPDLPSAIAPNAPTHYRTLWMVNFFC
jgi:hypothetical protein